MMLDEPCVLEPRPALVPCATAANNAAVEGRPDLCLSRMNEEHGILTAACGQTKLKVGDVLTLVPIHVCTAVNQQNAVYLLENGRLTRHPVDARGMTV